MSVLTSLGCKTVFVYGALSLQAEIHIAWSVYPAVGGSTGTERARPLLK